MYAMHLCRKCGVELNNENSHPSRDRLFNYICHSCAAKITKIWYHRNPEKYKISYAKNNKKAKLVTFEKIAKARNTSIVCEKCGCDDFSVLTVNHIIPFFENKHKKGSRKKIDYNNFGRNLWLQIRRMDEKEIGEKYNILCAMCNWLNYYIYKKQKEGTWTITWKKT